MVRGRLAFLSAALAIMACGPSAQTDGGVGPDVSVRDGARDDAEAGKPDAATDGSIADAPPWDADAVFGDSLTEDAVTDATAGDASAEDAIVDADAADAIAEDAPSGDASKTDGAASDSGSTLPDFEAEIVVLRADQPLAADQQARIVVVVRNTGSQPWVGPTFALDNTLAPLWSTSLMPLGANETILPRGIRMFAFLVRAPSAAGTYTMAWQMRRSATPFGATASKMMSVVTGPTYAVRTDFPWYPNCTFGGWPSDYQQLCGNCLSDGLCSPPGSYAVREASVTLPWALPYYGQAFDAGTSLVASSAGTVTPVSSGAPRMLVSERPGYYFTGSGPSAFVGAGIGGDRVQMTWRNVSDPNGSSFGSAILTLYRSGIIEFQDFGSWPGGLHLGNWSGTATSAAGGRRSILLPSWISFPHPADLVLIDVEVPTLVPPGEFIWVRATFLNIGETGTGVLQGVTNRYCDFDWNTSASVPDLSVGPGELMTYLFDISSDLPLPSDPGTCLMLYLPTDAPGTYQSAFVLPRIPVGYPDAGVPDAEPAQDSG